MEDKTGKFRFRSARSKFLQNFAKPYRAKHAQLRFISPMIMIEEATCICVHGFRGMAGCTHWRMILPTVWTGAVIARRVNEYGMG